jgi:hypothetical protein
MMMGTCDIRMHHSLEKKKPRKPTLTHGGQWIWVHMFCLKGWSWEQCQPIRAKLVSQGFLILCSLRKIGKARARV